MRKKAGKVLRDVKQATVINERTAKNARRAVRSGQRDKKVKRYDDKQT